MHWVDRGDEPEALAAIRERYTPRWVSYYPDKSGRKPSDSRWREFRGDLEERFSGLCAYCEESCRGQVDHFRPKSRFPALVYEWTNWLYVCPECNQAKGDKWPEQGYVDPCAESEPDRPENYFDFDTRMGYIKPRAGLSASQREMALQMIEHVKLNDFHHVEQRRLLLELLRLSFHPDQTMDSIELEDTINWLVSRSTQLSSLTRAYLAERGYPTGG